ncbi:hypothetical protein LTR56_016678 [Elasticomyces elasticus]|nr:hypothetical protein LTR56_016678 [Elasticomyces elasticus]KAK5735700.1 hypothetical protein LTS12_026401 [Elasticomyces elasticus]
MSCSFSETNPDHRRFFSYNAQIIGYMNPLFSELYKDAGFGSTIKTRLSNSYLIGEIFGMLFFGFLIDRIGRRTGIVFATLFLVLGVIIATAAHGTTPLGMFWMMIIGRGIAGFGAGGEYPTCTTGSSEAADENEHVRRKRGILVAMATDFSIDLGFVVAGVVALIVLAAYDERTSDGVWRVCFGLGFVLPVAILETDAGNESRLVHVVTYPFGIFSSSIISSLNPNDTLVQNIGYGTVVNLFYLPGCVVGGFLMDWIGRKQTMTLGFICWSIMGFIIGGALGPIQSITPLFLILYGIFNAFGEMGPGVATFLCGAESFPTPLRGHFLGLAAAFGKAGAAIGTQVFTPIQNSVFLIGAAFAATGGLIAWFLIPDRERDLESEDARFRAYLEANGYSGLFGESLEKDLKTTNFKV